MFSQNNLQVDDFLHYTGTVNFFMTIFWPTYDRLRTRLMKWFSDPQNMRLQYQRKIGVKIIGLDCYLRCSYPVGWMWQTPPSQQRIIAHRLSCLPEVQLSCRLDVANTSSPPKKV